MSGKGGDSPVVTGARRWGFIGSGKMATALVKGMIRAGIAPVEAICASDPLANARNLLAAETGVAVFDSNPPVVERSDVLILAVKPQSMREVLDELRPLVTAEHLVVSIAAGITIASIVEGLGSKSGSFVSCPIRPPWLERAPRRSHSGRELTRRTRRSSERFSAPWDMPSAWLSHCSTRSRGSRAAGRRLCT